MRDEAEKRIGHLYPKVRITQEMASKQKEIEEYVGQELTPIAWIWARTVKSPNPAFRDREVPLASTFVLSKMKGKEAYIKPVVDGSSYSFQVCAGVPKGDAISTGTKLTRGANFQCLLSGSPIQGDYIKGEGKAGRIGARLMAIVAEGSRGRVYIAPTQENVQSIDRAQIKWAPEQDIYYDNKSNFCVLYGLKTFRDLFTQRQLLALSTFSDLIQETEKKILTDAERLADESTQAPSFEVGKSLIEDYAASICTFLALVADRLADYNSSLCSWHVGGPTTGTKIRNTFGRQALPMTWDFAEVNIFSSQSGSFSNSLDYTSKAISCSGPIKGMAEQADAGSQDISAGKIVSTDPPYYNNIGYSDLADFFYVWLRRSLKKIYPDLFATLLVPKEEEIVATATRHGGKDNAEMFFLNGMTRAMRKISSGSNPAFPVTIYYAFKQAEEKTLSGAASTGWETFLAAVIKAGLAIHGTWPLRTELANRMIGSGTNALASSIVLSCRQRDANAQILSRNDFRRELRLRLPHAIQDLERANIAPVDVAQAAIGPGMAIFSQAKAVLNPDDSPMSVREALIEINAALDEHLSQDEGAFDADTRFALTFFESYGYSERPYGDAESLAVARNISVDGVAKAGILRSAAGKVQLLRRDQLDNNWNPTSDSRLCVWEATQHLIKRLEADGEGGAAALLLQLRNLPGHGELAANCRALAYRLYNHCEKTKQAEEARSYNGLVIAWPELERQASAAANAQSAPLQTSLI
ncbi:MAG: DUF1156 domain-containing protein [Synechococcaceae cyanobacterium]